MKFLLSLFTLLSISCLSAADSNSSNESNMGSYRAFNTPVNYNYTSLSLGSGSYANTDKLDALILSGGGEGMITEDWIFNFYYTGKLVDETLFVGSNNILNFGVAYRYPLLDKLDITIGADVLYAWYNLDVYIPTFSGTEIVTQKENDFGYAFKSSLRYGFTHNLESSLLLEQRKLYDDSSTLIGASVSYYFTENFGLGGTYTTIINPSADNGSEYQGFIKINF